MKKIIVSLSIPLAVVLSAVVFAVPAGAQVQCPVGYTCVSIPPTNPVPCYVFSVNLDVGSTGADVVALQTWLIANNYHIPSIESGTRAKGTYDSETALAVRMYQNAVGLPGTGVFDVLTRQKLSCSTSPTPPTASPTITVLSPNGGEKLIANQPYIIKWATSNFGALTVSLDLVDDRGFLLQNIASNIPNTGNYTWNIPAGLAGGTAVGITASSFDKGPSALDTSDKLFVISNSLPVLCFTFNTDFGIGSRLSPDVANLQTWLIAHGYSISGIVSDADKGYFGTATFGAVLRYQRYLGIAVPTGYVGPVTRDALNKSCANPPQPPVASCPVGYICVPTTGAPGNPTIGCPVGYVCTPVSTGQASITILSPNGGERYLAGGPVNAGGSANIRWGTSNFGSKTVWLTLADKYGTTVPGGWLNAANIPNTGSYTWVIPNNIVPAGTTGAFKVVASSFDPGPSASDLSDNYFEIAGMPIASTTTSKPLITSITPDMNSKGTPITINGSGFVSGDVVYFSQNGNAIIGMIPSSIQSNYIGVTPSLDAGVYDVQVGYGDSRSNSAKYTVVTPTTKPSITSFIASPTTLATGGISVLSWNSQNAQFCLSSGAWPAQTRPLYGSERITPTSSTNTYTLTCVNKSSGISVTDVKSVSVQVTGATDPVPAPIPAPSTRREDIRQLYLTLLNREPDQAGWDYWYNSSATIDQIRVFMTNSDEYRRLHPVQPPTVSPHPEWNLVSTSITSAAGVKDIASSSIVGNIVLRATAIGGAMNKPVTNDFSVVFASTTQTNGGYNSSNSISVVPVTFVTPSDATVGDRGTYTVNIAAVVYSSNPLIAHSQALFMAIKDIDAVVGNVATINQTSGIGGFMTQSANLSKGTFSLNPSRPSTSASIWDAIVKLIYGNN